MGMVQVHYGARRISLVSVQSLQEGGNNWGRQKILAPEYVIIMGLLVA